MTAFGGRVRELRIAARKTLREVGHALKVSHVYVCQVEKGMRPPFLPPKLEKFAELVGADITELSALAVEERTVYRRADLIRATDAARVNERNAVTKWLEYLGYAALANMVSVGAHLVHGGGMRELGPDSGKEVE
jgi:transcriptional regulator with XRE-family HTH domain